VSVQSREHRAWLMNTLIPIAREDRHRMIIRIKIPKIQFKK